MSQKFEMKDLGPAWKILGMEISRDGSKELLHLSQRGYIRKILERYGMKDVKLVELPFVGHFRLSKTISPKIEMEAQEMERVLYASSVGSVVYSMVCCRSDIIHIVS